MREKDLSVVIGCYNAAAHIESTVLELRKLLDGLDRAYELLIVEDGSRDHTVRILDRLRLRIPALTVLRNPKNMGKGFSIRNGVLNSSGRKVVFTDIDMAFSPSNIRTVIRRLDEGCDMVVANRRLPESIYTANNHLIRHVYRRHQLGRAFNLLVRCLYKLRVRDTQSGLKGFSRAAAMRIFPHLRTDGFLFDVEIFIRGEKLGLEVAEIPVHVTYDSDESTVRKFQQFLSLIPTLTRIKWYEILGTYDAGASWDPEPLSSREEKLSPREEKPGGWAPTPARREVAEPASLAEMSAFGEQA